MCTKDYIIMSVVLEHMNIVERNDQDYSDTVS